MPTQEWVVSDEEIWNYDYTDDFIWIPEDVADGKGRWIAKGIPFYFDAVKEIFSYVADDGQRFRYVADGGQRFRYVADEQIFRYVANKE